MSEAPHGNFLGCRKYEYTNGVESRGDYIYMTYTQVADEAEQMAAGEKNRRMRVKTAVRDRERRKQKPEESQ